MANFRHAVNFAVTSGMFDDDDFMENLTNAVHGARSNSHLLGAAPPKKIRKARGPRKMKTKIRIYYLPDAAIIPRFTQKPQDPLIHQHITSGYGKIYHLTLIFLCVLFDKKMEE